MKATACVFVLVLGFAMGCGDDDERIPDARPPTPDAPVVTIDAASPDAPSGDAAVTDATTTDATATFDLVFSGSGYTPHDGQDIWFALWDDANSSNAVATRTTATDGSGNLSETFTGVLVAGHSYTLYWAADLNGNGACNTPPADHGWSLAIASVSGTANEMYNHDTNFDTTVCNFISP